MEFSKIISTLFAGCSVFVAIYIYHRNTEREYFRNFRNALVTYRQLLDEASDLFDEIGLVEIGYSISNQLRSICPNNLSPREVHDFFYNDENENFLKQAIYLGIGESKTILRAKEISKEIQRIPTAHRELFPITNTVLSILNAYYTTMFRTISSGDLISGLFAEVRKQRETRTVQEEKTHTDTDLIFRELGVYITIFHTDLVNNYADTLFEHCDRIAGVISHTYETKSDKSLRKISNKEKSLNTKYREKSDSVSAAKALFEYLKFYKAYVEDNDWDTLVECKTLMENVVVDDEE